jgi:DNA helicase-2/ATP-dependent DNA helicase PcrA
VTPAPTLSGEALAAVRHRGSHLQIIAGAGSGKTEIVSQRVTDLLADGAPSKSIIAFTFTERAAEELKARVTRRVEERLGAAGVDQLTALYVGTIHGYCFRLLQQHVPRFESYDVLDDNRLTAFLVREGTRLELRQVDEKNRLFTSVARFLESVAVVENELIDPDSLEGPFGAAIRAYYATLDRYRLLTYGQQIFQAVRALEDPALVATLHEALRHVVVDEYQDVNPAQERLIELLAGPEVHLCVVGDDQQAIYQWRGSDVANIVTFPERYGSARGGQVACFTITVNRRSRPQLIAIANDFAATIPERIEKEMLPHRDGAAGGQPEVVVWKAPDEEEEAGIVTNLIIELAERGARFSDVAVLVRTRAAYRRLVDAFATFDVPVQPGGRTGLFEQPEAVLLGRTFAWLSGVEWRMGFDRGQPVADEQLFGEYESRFRLSPRQRSELVRYLLAWRAAVPGEGRQADLVGELYGLLELTGVRTWDLADSMQLNRLGTLARFTALLADYESVRRRARRDDEHEGEQVGGQDRGTWYYRNLALHIVNYAAGAYEGFDGEEDFDLDAIDLTTVHRAKGLEWPAVFVPSVTAKRFPSDRVGRPQPWLLARDRFDAARYEGSDADERRLFYVAVTRARDWLSVSRHERVTRNRVAASPYWRALSQLEVEPDSVELPEIENRGEGDDDPIVLSYSQLAMFLDCGYAFRLRDRIGFQPRLAPELGYGKAVHS